MNLDYLNVVGKVLVLKWAKYKIKSNKLSCCRGDEQQRWVRIRRRRRCRRRRRSNPRGRSTGPGGGRTSGDARRSLLHIRLLLLGRAVLPVAVPTTLLLPARGSRAGFTIQQQRSNDGSNADDYPFTAREDARCRWYDLYAVPNRSNW